MAGQGDFAGLLKTAGLPLAGNAKYERLLLSANLIKEQREREKQIDQESNS